MRLVVIAALIVGAYLVWNYQQRAAAEESAHLAHNATLDSWGSFIVKVGTTVAAAV